MSKLIITQEIGEAAILGGGVLGGGGGGSMKKGIINVRESVKYGMATLIDIDDITPDTILITGSAVGAPAAKEAHVTPEDYVRVVKILRENGCPNPGGFIPNECGGSSITNGWIPAAMMKLPVVDALCNGRAHPTGSMGSMGLHKDPNYVARQAACGGSKEKGLHLELHVAASLDVGAPLIRAAADKAGGLVIVARNPVKASFAKKYGACGSLKQAIELGKRMKAANGGEAAVNAAVDFLGGAIVTRAKVSEIDLVTKGGFDSGKITIGEYETTFWNEYMTLEKKGERLGTFPDLIMTLSADGMPVTTAEIEQGQEVFIINVPASKLILGEGMRCMDLMKTIEPVVGKSIVEYIKL